MAIIFAVRFTILGLGILAVRVFPRHWISITGAFEKGQTCVDFEENLSKVQELTNHWQFEPAF